MHVTVTGRAPASQARSGGLCSPAGPRPLVVIELNRAARVAGTVRDSRRSVPIPSAVVLAMQATKRNLISNTVEAVDGAFELNGLHPGTVNFVARAAAPLIQSISVEAGQEVTDVVLSLQPASSLSGFVVDDTGGPVANVRLRVQYQDGSVDERFLLQSFVGGAVRTRADGQFRLTNLVPNRQLTIVAEGNGRSGLVQVAGLAPSDDRSDVRVVIR